jgi:hypothetical protein
MISKPPDVSAGMLPYTPMYVPRSTDLYAITRLPSSTMVHHCEEAKRLHDIRSPSPDGPPLGCSYSPLPLSLFPPVTHRGLLVLLAEILVLQAPVRPLITMEALGVHTRAAVIATATPTAVVPVTVAAAAAAA